MNARHVKQHEKHVRRGITANPVLHVIRRDIGLELLTAPLVVPAWWGLWKVCDVVWGWK